MEAVCFDMDGVLVDSEDYWIPYEKEQLLPQIGLADLDVDEITGMHYHEIYDYLVDSYGVEMDRATFVGWYDETAEQIYGEDVTLVTGAQALVDDLRERDVAVAVVSSAPNEWIDIVRERFALDVDAVVSAADIDGPGKPEPGIYEDAAAQLGVDPGRATAVEDSVHGIESARRADMHVVGFKHGSPDDTDRSNAHYVATDPDDLREHLLARADGD